MFLFSVFTVCSWVVQRRTCFVYLVEVKKPGFFIFLNSSFQKLLFFLNSLIDKPTVNF